MLRISIPMSALVVLSACSGHTAIRRDSVATQGPSVFVLTWPDYDGSSEKVESATWVLNGQSLGKGDAGYKHLIERMKAFPVGSTLKVQFTPPDATGGAEGYYVPLRSRRDDFLDAKKGRDIKVEFPPFGAGWY